MVQTVTEAGLWNKSTCKEIYLDSWIWGSQSRFDWFLLEKCREHVSGGKAAHLVSGTLREREEGGVKGMPLMFWRLLSRSYLPFKCSATSHSHHWGPSLHHRGLWEVLIQTPVMFVTSVLVFSRVTELTERISLYIQKGDLLEDL